MCLVMTIVSFKSLPEMKKVSKYNYCDIKMNVLIEYKSNFNQKTVAIIGEIQFLVRWMLQASLVKPFCYMHCFR